MDIRDYTKRKDKGLVRIVRFNDAHALIVRRFDAETGDSLPAEFVSLDKAELLKEREALIEKLAQLDLLIADVDNAPNIDEKATARGDRAPG